MTALRRYVFAIVAVCVAIAAGIALGNGPLQGTTPVNHGVSLSQANSRLRDQVLALRQNQVFSQALAEASGPALLRGELTTVSVAVFVLPGVSRATVTGVTQAITSAGGEIVVSGHFRPILVDPAKKTYVDSVATNSLRGLEDLASSVALTTYAKIGSLIARAYTGPSDALAFDDEATGIDAQLRGARLLTLHAEPARRASAIVVLAPGDHGGTNAVYAAHQIELQLVDALAADGDGVLVAAPAESSQPGGLIAAINDAGTMKNAVATLNVVDTTAGQTASVAALSAAVAGQPGAFGMKGSVPVLPPALAPAG